MKNSIKISALALAFAAFTFSAKAQTTTPTPTNTSTSTTTASGIRYSIGVDAGIPTGKLSNAYNWNLGGSLQVDIPIANKLFVTANAGYDNIFAKKNLNDKNIELLPVKAGLKYFVVSNFYVQGEAGASFLLNKSALGDNKSAAFIYAPQVGYQFQLGGKSFIDAGVRYEASTKFDSGVDDSKVNFFGLRVAYGF
ncbi:hypothetical protein [Mucilaginibacter sp.]